MVKSRFHVKVFTLEITADISKTSETVLIYLIFISKVLSRSHIGVV